MQNRAYGIETEYSIAVKARHGGLYTGGLTGEPFGNPSRLLFDLFDHRELWNESLNELCLYPQKSTWQTYFLGSNGGKLYFDNTYTFPEYATSECESIRGALINSLAGDTVVEDMRKQAMRDGSLVRTYQGEATDIYIVRINTSFRNDTPRDGSTTGCHENYLVSKAIGDYDSDGSCEKLKKINGFMEFMVPFLMTRQIFDGAGGIHWNEEKSIWEFVLSQRTFFTRAKTSTAAAGDGRGFLGFKRDESGSPYGATRLQVHSGDVPMSPFGKYIAMIATHLVVRAAEEGERQWRNYAPNDCWKGEFRELARDVTLRSLITLENGKRQRHYRATEVQRLYADFVINSIRIFSADEQRMFAEWTAALDRLDRGFEEVVREYDWAIKYVFFRTAFGGNISSAKARFSNFLYHDISERGIYNRLLKRGAVLCFALPDDIRNARMNPPPTRAEFRSRLIKALMRRKDNQTIQFPRDWGYFIGPTRSTAIPDPLERTNEAAENVLKNVEEHGVKKIPPNTPPASVDPEADFILPQEWE
ncbi:MAG: hypothetical protein A3A28_00395 [Candidatus Sungbacteria bacterium RIFCSPLOWO2_01_FULL_47_32]|uniref:Uncharacterized protein n=1 Tax=Candidatus Sungbacteria bacterium RIFCSPHIGHO2_01_FULL_47_32 TaxID=1802264 RepID=A0A1G2K7P9_9BACT|nr:MAG: hypothetical protein UX72_C0034G0004 [Parcubacteria group bacterium GW2011_GWA2_47_10]OGZ95456.1 MAG: hypothetical protein A2633_03580 [Candidatus Sungbacteria bacterium RIFCSPHIGHO2_01_FULL_47_32]OGZ99912.1 MAG: hypothetical protein A3D57_03620 [Candidatus Sungbacteria bacterium RIFCSPHIGHO2_02_FULL_46_12]OHA05319.1 MAG: hypothetical protein A3A28_00395 [Candidatus Sungbacteria bacterium RIFCSPLOWO2_01_FULL_47_32]